jgi:hypothetical protein
MTTIAASWTMIPMRQPQDQPWLSVQILTQMSLLWPGKLDLLHAGIFHMPDTCVSTFHLRPAFMLNTAHNVTAMSVTSKHPVLSGVMEINGVTTVMPQTKMQSGLLLES